MNHTQSDEELTPGKYILNCFAICAVITISLVLMLYVISLISDNADSIDAFFTLNIEFLNVFLAILYLNIVALASTLCISISLSDNPDIGRWYAATAASIVSYIVLMSIYCNSYWHTEMPTTFQSYLATFIWSPVWIFAIWFCVLMSEFCKDATK